MQDLDRPFRGRRLTWQQFYELRPDLKPANDNEVAGNGDRAGVEGGMQCSTPSKPHSVPIPQR